MAEKEIEEDPETFAYKLSTADLEDVVGYFSELYYNTGESTISDNAYDALVYCLNKKLKNDKSQLYNKQVVGALPRERLRAQLPYYMPSLDKVKPGADLTNFLNTQDNLLLSVKLDGVSAMVVYNDGVPVEVYLRGNGETGGDISYIIDHIDFPILEHHNDLVVRGEFVIAKQVWKDKYQKVGGFTTSRNFVCGKLNAGHPTQGLADIDFVAFDIMYYQDDNLPTLSETMEILEMENFKVAKYWRGFNLLTSDVITKFIKERHDNYYPIDGIVIGRDIPRIVPDKLENPSHTIAFKMLLEDQLRTTEIVEVDWRISRHGRLVPVAVFKPVYIEGRRVTKATAHNAARCIKEWQLAPGTKIQVTLSGSIIPKIVTVLETSDDPSYPPMEPKWEWKGCDIMLCDIENNPIVHLKRHVHFFTILNIPGIREGMLKRMQQGGLDTLEKILNTTIQDFQKINGIGPKKAAAFRKAITEKIPHAKLYRLMYASNCFPRGMGKTFLRQITTELPCFLSEITYAKLTALNGIGPKRANMFLEGLQRFKIFIQNFQNVELNNRKYFQELAQQGFNPHVKDHKFVFTTMNDDELEDYVLDHRGKLLKAVSDDTTAVVSGNIADITPKTLEAMHKGIKIYTIAEFKKQFNITV